MIAVEDKEERVDRRTFLMSLTCWPAVIEPQEDLRSAFLRHNEIVKAWNEQVALFESEDVLLSELQESLKSEPPRYIRSEHRMALERDIIQTDRRKIGCYERMLKLEK